MGRLVARESRPFQGGEKGKRKERGGESGRRRGRRGSGKGRGRGDPIKEEVGNGEIS